MVQNKTEPKRRGRPPAYDAEVALDRARDAFWDAGYAATSLDDLSAATGMKRPSLYGAFGDKAALYFKTVERYRAVARAGLTRVLSGERPLEDELQRMYDLSLSLYLSGERPRGCFVIGTATSEAVESEAARKALRDTLHEIDAAIAARFRLAISRKELPKDCDADSLARLASAVMQTLALRARAGETRAALRATATAGVALLVGRSPK